MIERINWMADQSEKGVQQSGGIMVNYLYRYASIGLLAMLLHMGEFRGQLVQSV